MDQLIEMERQKWDAFRRGDANLLGKMYDDGAISIGYAGDGSVGVRRTSELLRGLPDLDLEELALGDFEIVPLGDEGAVVTYRARFRTGRGVRTTVLASSVWHLEGAEWKTKFFQATATPEDAAHP